jgi:hypothetical protein
MATSRLLPHLGHQCLGCFNVLIITREFLEARSLYLLSPRNVDIPGMFLMIPILLSSLVKLIIETERPKLDLSPYI